MEPESAARTVLFADITDSSRLYERLGDDGGRRVVLECLELMKRRVEQAGGTVVDLIGDELLCTFADPTGAARAAGGLHCAIEAANARFPAAVSLRIGFHHGPVLRDGKRIFGDTVHIAKRVETLAKGQQTLTTGQARDLLPLDEQLLTRFVDRTPLKGKVEAVDLFEIVWDPDASTLAEKRDPTTARLRPMRELILTCGDRSWVVDSIHPTLTVGRDPQVDVVVRDNRVSRLHGRIEYRKKAFVFVDQSTNGSRVHEGGAERFVRRDECSLGGEGTIVLGPRDSEASSPSLAYRLRWRDRGEGAGSSDRH